MVGLIYGIIFVLLALLELRNNLLNSFVLFTISAIFFKGFLVSKDNYYFVGTILAIVFAILMTLVFVSNLTFSYGVFGYITLPYFFKLRRKLSA